MPYRHKGKSQNMAHFENQTKIQSPEIEKISIEVFELLQEIIQI